MEQNITDQIENIDLSDCYSLNREQCSLSVECKVWETETEDIDAQYHIYGTQGSYYIYNRENFCMDMNSSSIFIGCRTGRENDSFDEYAGIDLYDFDIYRNVDTAQYIAINKTGWIGDPNQTTWVIDQEAKDELLQHLVNLPEEDKYYPIGNMQYPKYCE